MSQPRARDYISEQDEQVNRPGDPRFYKLLDELAEIHARKSQDYSPGDDSLQNFRAAEDLGARPYVGLLLRVSDKWQRIKTYAKTGTLQNESIKDAHMDSAVYHLLALLLLEDEQPKPLFVSGMTYTPITSGGMWPPHLCQSNTTDGRCGICGAQVTATFCNASTAVPVTVAGSDEPAKVYIGEDSTTPDRDCIISHV